MKRGYRLLRVAEHKASRHAVGARLELVQWPAREQYPKQYEVFSYRIRPDEHAYQRFMLTRSKAEAEHVFEAVLAKDRTWHERK